MRPHYDPAAQAIHLPPGSTPFALAHERAHEAQQREQTRCWRIHRACDAWPIVCRLARLLVEWEATHLALTVLARIGRCDAGARREARAGLWSYVRACLISDRLWRAAARIVGG